MPLQRPTVLLVDDEEMLRRMLSYALQDHYPVVEAENGTAALQVAGRLGTSLGLVVTDITMPVMDGLEFARVFRLKEPSVPILFITGEDPAIVTGSGFNADVLAKPFRPDTFLDVVTRLIQRAITVHRDAESATP